MENVGELQYPCMVKSQIMQGGRGKAGGIKKAENADEARALAADLTSRPLKGEILQGVLVEEAVDMAQEFYMGVTVDDMTGNPIFILCTEGGMDIETVAKTHPDKLVREYLVPGKKYWLYEAVEICKKAGLSGKLLPAVAKIMLGLLKAFEIADASLAEINPLIVKTDGSLIAGDSKVVVDDNALYRHPEFQPRKQLASDEDKYEKAARDVGFDLVRLGGDVCILSGGAGFGMALLDAVRFCGGKPANFMDKPAVLGHNDSMNCVLDMVDDDKSIKSILMGFSLGASPVKRIVDTLCNILEKRTARVPIFCSITAAGASQLEMNLEQAAEKFAAHGVKFYANVMDAAQAAVDYAKEAK